MYCRDRQRVNQRTKSSNTRSQQEPCIGQCYHRSGQPIFTYSLFGVCCLACPGAVSGGHQVGRYVGSAAVDVADDRRPAGLDVVVTCTVFLRSTAAPAPRGGRSRCRRSTRARTMHTTGRDGSSRVTLIVTSTRLVVDQLVSAQFALDVAAAEPLRRDDRDRIPRRPGPARSGRWRPPTACAARQPLPPVAGGGTLDHCRFACPSVG